jgi:acyl-CoA thioester hydrolase
MNAPPTELWDHADPFVLPVLVGEADIDSFGHVNNAVYLRWLTECAWAHSAAVGLPEDVCVALRRGMAVRGIHLDLLASAYLGDALLVGDWVTANDRRLRATRTFQIVDPAGKPPCCAATSTTCASTSTPADRRACRRSSSSVTRSR